MSTPEWKQYKPTKKLPSWVSGEYARDIPYVTTVYDPVKLPSKPTSLVDMIRAGRKKPVSLIVSDGNNGDGRASIDRSAFFKAGKYPSYEGLPEYYQEKTHVLPSKEQFVSEGGLFGEPIVAGDETAEQGILGGKAFSLEWLLILGGVLLICLLIFAM